MLPRFLLAERYSPTEWKKIVLFIWLGVLSAVGFVVLAVYSAYRGYQCDPGWPCKQVLAHFCNVFGSTSVSSLAALASGALVGFLFGVPRYRTEHSGEDGKVPETSIVGMAPRFIPNTNLEQISDWLTKLFVGASLVQLSKLPSLMVRFGNYFSVAMVDAHVTVGAAIYFAILGFFIAFFYAGLYLTDTLNAPSELQQTFQTRAPLAEKSTIETLTGASGEDLVRARIALADSIPDIRSLQTLRPSDTEFAVSELRRLAARYETIRHEMPPGDQRTVQMEGIVSQMRLIAGAAMPRISEFQTSVIAGERLACVVMLQLRPDLAYLGWLVDRFRGERPFVQYHSALALRSAARRLRASASSVKEAVLNAIEILRPSASESSDRMRVLQEAQREADAAESQPRP